MLRAYSLIMLIIGVISYGDWDAAFSEIAMAISTIVYLLLIEQKPRSVKYTEIIATIA